MKDRKVWGGAAMRLVGIGICLIGGAALPLAAQQPLVPILEFVFEEVVTLGEASAPGETARGARLISPITGGTFEGPEIKGTVLPGGWDWQLRRADGCTDVEADYFLQTDDGVTINVRNTGVICPGEGGAMRPVRTHARKVRMAEPARVRRHARAGPANRRVGGENPFLSGALGPRGPSARFSGYPPMCAGDGAN